MNWLTNFVLPKIRAVVAKKEVPDNLWHKCPSCGQMLFHRELEANLYVCGSCGHHLARRGVAAFIVVDPQRGDPRFVVRPTVIGVIGHSVISLH